ncbi:hypothetical protein [Phenylobacterium deserti]|uniref:Uncharacterized protein n=1 Tax=Phenylobacterium deserti TaxID=1914756 RepID=A0A328ARS7_9CAUL|nr:hypothetical protein [Phenylobacterium deserti]RAK57753.1 hypothetical protein DJ018_07475 [Phenylobacterium deserti]
MTTEAKLARLAAALRDIAPHFDQADRAAFATSLADALEGGTAPVQIPASRLGAAAGAFRLH